MVGTKPTEKAKARRFERFKHALWAGSLSFVLALLVIFEPVDQIIWTLQGKTITTEASGDIVYIGSENDLSDPNYPARREQLAQLVTRLDEAGVDRIYVDGVFAQASNVAADTALNASLREFSGDSYLIDRIQVGVNQSYQWHQSTGNVGDGIDRVGSALIPNYMGYVWEAPYTVTEQTHALPNVAMHMADGRPSTNEVFQIAYNIELETVPTLTFAAALEERADLSQLAGKTVIVGSQAQAEGIEYAVPGYRDVSGSLLHIFGAETLRSGKMTYINGTLCVLFAFLLVLASSQFRGKTVRRIAYAIVVSALPAAFVASVWLGWRIPLADAIAVFGIYATFRLRSVWKDSFALVDLETNLPSFAALETDKDVAETVPAIIVAKIHRFEQVRRSLPKELHAEYMLRITSRLKAATQDATIYLGQGHMIAWTMQEKDPALLNEHLEGLRALFSAPLLVADQQVDVGISFGVDISPSPNVTRRLASAVEAAEKTNETYDPIAVADTASDEDLIWNISLQARIDAALDNGEIYLAYQPKVMVQTGEIIGVEALVRWKDPVKGHIPPDNFIRQCETAGRMTHLTRFVLEEACKAGNAFEDKGIHLPVAVNVSATLVHERGIVEMVSEVLDKTGFDPRRLTLEITETYRISNIDRAAEVLGELQSLGPKISMDDFGVGAASLEALLRLPFSELKIDRTFVSQMASSKKAAGIVRSVLQMGKDLRIIVVAEGVEDAGTLTLLRDSGCLVAQGFGISRPVDFDKIVKFQSDGGEVLLRNMV